MSEDTRKKLSDNAKNNPNYGMRGKTLSEEIKKKISDMKKGKPSASKGTIHITNDIEDKMIHVDELDYYMSLGWRRGRKKFSDDARKNISNGHKGLQVHNKNKICIFKDNIEKFIFKEELFTYLSTGWCEGRKPMTQEQKIKLSKAQKGKKGMKGWKSMNNGKVNTRVHPDEYDNYKSQGWVDGYIKKEKNNK